MFARSHVVTLLLGCLGGFLAASVREVLETRAEAGPPPARQLTAEQFVLVDASNRTLAQLAKTGDGTPCLFLYDKGGKVRLQAGVYPDGQPFFGLFDAQNNAVGLFRVAGSQGSPVVVLKARGRDRLIIGLNMDDAAQEPFIQYADNRGEQHELLPAK